MAKRSVRIFDVYWSPTGQKIATVEASTAKIAKSKAPMPYRRFKGEIYVEDRGERSSAGPNLYDRKNPGGPWSGKAINHRVPNGRMVPARIKHNGKTYAGKVKRINGRVKIFVTPEVARKINPRQIHEYLVILHNKNTVKGHTMTITASTAGNASREAKRRKKSMADARNWKVFSVKRLS